MASSAGVFVSDSTDDTPCGTELSNGMTTSSSIIHPKLHFSLTYNTQSKDLHVTVIEGKPENSMCPSHARLSWAEIVFKKQQQSEPYFGSFYIWCISLHY